MKNHTETGSFVAKDNRTEAENELADYVHWSNNIRIYGTLGYLTPVEFKQQTL
ncbi:IS3 family transposase [Bacillus mycoides]|uniref:IS3 family transposase n=1 Tax=Bacillus mycoides TaxID=1405 RepID=UPI003D211B7A